MNSAGRILILPKGEYDPNKQYEMLDLVSRGGNAWLAKKPSIGIEPNDANGEHWMKLCQIDQLAADAASKMAESGAGYEKLLDGTLICYGQTNVAAGAGETEVVFPVAFVDENVSVTLTGKGIGMNLWMWNPTDGTKGRIAVKNVTTGNPPVESAKASYIAVGRWK